MGPGRKTGCDAAAEGAPGPHGGYRGAPGRRIGTPRKRGPCRLPGRAAGQESLRHDGSRQRQACSRPAAPGARPGRSDRGGGGATAGEAEYDHSILRIHQTAALRIKLHAYESMEKATSRAYGRTAAQCRDGFRVWQNANAEPDPDCGQAMRPQARGMRTELHPETAVEMASGSGGCRRAERSAASPGVLLLCS